jgi:hypothetical protein
MAVIEGEARFLNTLHSEELSNNVFRILEPLIYYSKNLHRVLEIQPIICDFESCGMLRTSNEAGALHDYGYRIDCPWKLSRREVDDLYFEALLADGNTPRIMAMAKWFAVRTFGARYFQKHRISACAEEIALINEMTRCV